MDKDVKMCSLLEPLQEGWEPKVEDRIASEVIGHDNEWIDRGIITKVNQYDVETTNSGILKAISLTAIIYTPNTDRLIAMLEGNWGLDKIKHGYLAWNPDSSPRFTGKTHKIAILKLVAFELYGLTWDEKGVWE